MSKVIYNIHTREVTDIEYRKKIASKNKWPGDIFILKLLFSLERDVIDYVCDLEWQRFRFRWLETWKSDKIIFDDTEKSQSKSFYRQEVTQLVIHHVCANNFSTIFIIDLKKFPLNWFLKIWSDAGANIDTRFNQNIQSSFLISFNFHMTIKLSNYWLYVRALDLI